MIIPDGYRRLEVGETIQQGDKWFDQWSGGFIDVLFTGVLYFSHIVYIRRISP